MQHHFVTVNQAELKRQRDKEGRASLFAAIAILALVGVIFWNAVSALPELHSPIIEALQMKDSTKGAGQ